MTHDPRQRCYIAAKVSIGLALAALLYLVSRSNYPLFHSIVDAVTVFIAAGVFLVVWNGRRRLDNHYYLFIAIAFLAFALLDFMHLIGNKGMGVFPEYGNLGPTFYIASRYVLGGSFLLAPLFIKRKLSTVAAFAVFLLVVVLVLLSVLHWRNFPTTFIEGVGLTAFKVYSDYAVCLMLLGGLGLLLPNRQAFDARVFKLISFSLVLSIATGLAFTLYADPFGVANAVGHFFQIASFALIYLAFVETVLTQPQNLLFRNLKQSNESVLKLNAELETLNLSMSRDIAARKRAEERLRESEERLRAERDKIRIVADFTYDWEYWRGPDNRFLYISPSCETVTGYSREDFLRDPDLYARIIHPDDRERVLRHMREDLVHQERCELEFRVVRRDGEERWIGHACRPVLDEHGKFLGRRASNRDATERKRAEGRLRESEERYRGLFNSMSEGFALHEIVTDAGGRPCDYRFLEVNPAFERLTGLRRDGIVGRRVLDVLPGTEPFWIERYGRVALTGEPAHFEDHSAALGRWYEVFAYRPAPRQFAAIFTDITGRKRAEEDLRRVNENLEQFAYVASHDLQEPLRIMSSYSQLLAKRYRGKLDADADDFIGFIVDSAAHMQKLITDLLAYSRAGRGDVDLTDVDCNAVARKVAAGLRATIEAAGASVLIDPLPVIRAHEPSLIQLFQNLIGNAVKFRREDAALEVRITAVLVNGHSSWVNGHSSFVNGQSSWVNGQSSFVNGQSSLVSGQSSWVNGHSSLVVDQGPMTNDPMTNDPMTNDPMTNDPMTNDPMTNDAAQPHMTRPPGVNVWRFAVRDNGIGIEPQYRERIFGIFQRLHGRDQYEGTGIGLSICKRVVEHLGGRIWVESEPGRGSTFYFTVGN